MACNIEFIEEICDMLSPLGAVRSRKMMGDYVIYLNDKCVITACDNMAFVKKLPCIESMMQDAEVASPYEGAKPAYILDTADRKHSVEVIKVLWEHMPFPKKKKNA